MKKKWLVLGLAAMMSFGCLFACDEDDGNNDGGEVKGEEVTQAGWETAFANIDYTNVIGEASGTETENGVTSSYTTSVVYAPNKYYMVYEETVTDGTSAETDGEGYWMVKADNGLYYSFTAQKLQDGGFATEDGSWQQLKSEEKITCDLNYWTDNWGDIFNGDEFINENVTSFTYDAQTGVYYKERNATTADCTKTGRVEILIKDGKLYSLKVEAVSTGEYEGSESATYTFKAGEINLPKEDELNTMIASVKAYYRFESITMDGQTYGVGDLFLPLEHVLDSQFITLTLNADGTALFIAYMTGQEDVQTGTWEETNESFSVTIAGTPQEFMKDGDKLVCEGAFTLVLTK